MSEPVILAEGLGKQYHIGAVQKQTSLLAGVGSAARRLLRPTTADHPTFWALDNVSFSVQQGEVLGLIGRNGAGKSTLLKILSRITPPTTGRALINGRVGSLLEVGTGFHPEMTGRENIFMNGVLLGMKRTEVARKFDEIVAFSGIEKFIDTPVKRYSSGMYVRLAFAVAAHLETDILIVDEVLAVGDASFQQKSLGKMSQVTRDGRTVIFVSHSMAAIAGLCTRCLRLDAGRLTLDGPTDRVIAAYLHDLFEGDQTGFLAPGAVRYGSGKARITDFWLEDAAGQRVPVIVSGQDVRFCFAYESCDGQPIAGKVSLGFSVVDEQDRTLFILYNDYHNQTFEQAPAQGVIRCGLQRFPLISASYRVTGLLLVDGEEADRPEKGLGKIIVSEGDFYGTGRAASLLAPFLVPGEWSLAAVPGVRLGG